MSTVPNETHSGKSRPAPLASDVEAARLVASIRANRRPPNREKQRRIARRILNSLGVPA